MASRLDQALDEVIRDRRSERSGHNRRNNNNNNDRLARRQTDNGGGIRKRLGTNSSQTIRSFVRTVNVQPSDRRAGRNVNSPWSHDMFDDDDNYGRNSIISRLGNQRSSSNFNNQRNTQVEIAIENLHYNVTEKDVEELFNTVADVVKARLIFDISGRSTGVATVRYNSKEDAEKAIKKYNNVELDGQAMKIEIKERAPHANNDRRRYETGSRGKGRGRFNDNRPDRYSRNNNTNNSSKRSTRDNRQKKELTAEDLDKEMESYMKSNSNNDIINEDTDMMLD